MNQSLLHDCNDVSMRRTFRSGPEAGPRAEAGMAPHQRVEFIGIWDCRDAGLWFPTRELPF